MFVRLGGKILCNSKRGERNLKRYCVRVDKNEQHLIVDMRLLVHKR